MHRLLAFAAVAGVLTLAALAGNTGRAGGDPPLYRPVSEHADVHTEGDHASTARVTDKPRYMRVGTRFEPVDITPKPEPDGRWTHAVKGRGWLARLDAANHGAGYRFERDGLAVTWTPAGDRTGETIHLDPCPDGVKETYTLDRTSDGVVSWRFETGAASATLEDGVVLFRDGTGRVRFRTMPATAADAAGTPVPVSVELAGDTLTYRALVPPDAALPVTVDPGTTTGDILDAGHSITMATYLESRNATASSAINANVLSVGTYVLSNDNRVYRSDLAFPLALPDVQTVAACTLYVWGHTDQSDTDIQLYMLGASAAGSTFEMADFNDFNGWQSSGGYTGTILNESWNSSSFVTGAYNHIVFNQAGRDSLTAALEDTLRIVLLSQNDYQGAQINGSAYVGFRSRTYQYPPYLSLSYVPYQCNVEYVNAYPPAVNRTLRAKSTTYAAARDQTSHPSIRYAPLDTLGQYKASASDWRVNRTGLSIPLERQYNVVYACTLFVRGTSDRSLTDFAIEAREGTWTAAGDTTAAPYYSFDGRGASGSPWNGTNLLESFNTTGFNSAGENALVFNAAGRDRVLAAAGDTLRLVLLSSRDVSNTAPTGEEYVVFNTQNARLSVRWALNDSLPADVAMTVLAPDSIRIAWRDRCFDETGWRIVNLADTSEAATASADAESLDIGGLVPNTLYRWMVQVTGGALDGECSAPDSARTYAAIPGQTFVSVVEDSLIHFILDPGTNPAGTAFAVQDSMSGAFVDPTATPDTLRAGPLGEWGWRTLADWGAAAGDTLGGLAPDSLYVLRAKARTEE